MTTVPDRKSDIFDDIYCESVEVGQLVEGRVGTGNWVTDTRPIDEWFTNSGLSSAVGADAEGRFRYRICGSTMFFHGNVRHTTAGSGSGTYLLRLPTNILVDIPTFPQLEQYGTYFCSGNDGSATYSAHGVMRSNSSTSKTSLQFAEALEHNGGTLAVTTIAGLGLGDADLTNDTFIVYFQGAIPITNNN